MGRRPNPLVVEFFERGPKVSDNSNRYEHTCKRCGVVFPKGRIDSLMNHLLRKCPQLTNKDRQLVFQQISATSERQQSAAKQAPVVQMPLMLRHEDLPEVTLPAYQQHEQSALDTLAEVSRRHLDYSSNGAPSTQREESRGKTLSEVLTEQAEQELIMQLASYGVVPTSQQDINSANQITLDASPLVQAATAASQQLELAQASQDVGHDQNDQPLDPRLDDTDEPRQFLEGIIDFSETFENPSVMTYIPKRVKRLKDPPKVPLGAPTPEFGLLQMNKEGRKRKRFDSDRRKEVSDIRKQGACIRCRMLKKPCSGDDPCTTCKTVQSARLWKAKCLRTRLADEFTLWSSNLFQMRMNTAMSTVAELLLKDSVPGRVEARILCVSNDCFTFPAKTFGNVKDPSGLTTLLDGGEAGSDRLEQYSDQIIKACAENETSSFMKASVEQAQALLDAENTFKPVRDTTSNSARKCHNLQDQLLKNVLELWLLTRILTLPPDARWTLRFIPAQEEQTQNNDEKNLKDEDHMIPMPSPSYPLIVCQLLATVEMRCSKLGKTIMNELERRLLQRQQASPFATFLSAVVLLASVERMTGLFQAFDTNIAGDPKLSGSNETAHVEETPTQHKDASDEILPETTFDGEQLSTHRFEPHSWPLATHSSTYWTQGQNFAELLTMLLRMRALPPKTNVTTLGTLSANPDHSAPMRINGRAVKEYVNPQTKAASAWLDPLGLNVAQLIEKRDSIMPSNEDGIEAWEMKFVSHLILPENVGVSG